MGRRLQRISIPKLMIHGWFIVFSIIFIIPLWVVISISFSNETDIIHNGYKLIPESLDFTAYQYIFKNPDVILNAYKVTTISSVAGLAGYLLIASMIAYTISRSDFKFRKPITFYLFFTMLFSGGLVPYYILLSQYLDVRNTYWALILPLLGNVWYIFIMRTSFQQIPKSIIESAMIDGAKEMQIFFRIIIPLSTPVLATIGLLQLLSNWNSWFNALLFIDRTDLYPLQYLLQTTLRNIQELTQNMENRPLNLTSSQLIPTESTRMAMAIVATGPMLFVFPFFQKYFVQGLTVGSVKG